MNILEEANKVTKGARRKAYGPPEVNFLRIAQLWSAYLSFEIKVEHIPMLMVLFKVAREAASKHRDNLVDIAGYARTQEMLDDSEKQKQNAQKRVGVLRDPALGARQKTRTKGRRASS